MGILDLLLRPGGGTVDQVMRDAKAPRLPGPAMLGGPDMPTENIGQVGERPPIPPQNQLRPLKGPADEAMFGEPSPMAMRLPPPPSAQPPAPPPDPLQAIIDGQPASGGGLPVQPPGGSTVPAAQAATPRAVTPEQSEASRIRAQRRQMLLGMARILTEKGGPASQVRASQLLFEVQKDVEAEAAEKAKLAEAEAETQRGLSFVDETTASGEDKQNAKAMLKLGIKNEKLPEILRLNDAGYKQSQERREQFVKWGSQVQTAARDLGTIEVNADRAIKILDESNLTTGLGGYASSFIPGSAHNQLLAALDPLKSLTGYGYLQEMREQSKTGGAVGNVTENETKWLMGIQGSLDPINNEPDVLKENIRTIVRGKKIVAEMRKLAPALDAGDPAAWDKYAQLTQELGKNGATVKARIKPDVRSVQPANPDLDAKYGVQ